MSDSERGSGSSDSSSGSGSESGSGSDGSYSSDDEQDSRFKVSSVVKKTAHARKSSSPDRSRSNSPIRSEHDSRKRNERVRSVSPEIRRRNGNMKADDDRGSLESGEERDDDSSHNSHEKKYDDRDHRQRDYTSNDRSDERHRDDDTERSWNRSRESNVRERQRERERRHNRNRRNLDDRKSRRDNSEDYQKDTLSDRRVDSYRGDRGYSNNDRERERYRDLDRPESSWSDRRRDDRRRERDVSPDKTRSNDRREENRYRDRRRDRYRDQTDDENQEKDSRNEKDRSSRADMKRKAEEPSLNQSDEAGAANNTEEAPAVKKPKTDGADVLTTRTGGAYIPPARLRMMQQQITDKNSAAFQRIAWEALKKSINGLINKVNVSNLTNIVRELFQENIVRGRGLLARSIIQAQTSSSTFTHVYGALVAIINTKFPQNGELILKRLIIQFRKGFKRNDKALCLAATKFIAHLVNQQVAHEVLSLEILTLLLENPTDDSVEVAIGFLKECGQKLTEVSPRGIHVVFERLRSILHEGQIDKRVQYMVEVMFAVRKDGFKDHVAVIEELDLVEEDEQFTHLLTLDEEGGPEDMLNVFKVDPEYEFNEEKYKILKKEILDEGSSDEESGSGSGSDDSDDEDEDEGEEGEAAKMTIIDQTETNLVALRRTIYLTIQSSLDFQECAHKLLKMEMKPGQEVELCSMILDCCAQQRTYEKFFGLLAQRFCMLNKIYVEPFEKIFQEQYETIHRLETNKLRNVAKMFAHLLYTDAISWGVLQWLKLNEEDTTSSSRIFIKILFQELSEFLGLPRLNNRLKDETLQVYFEGLFPRDNPRNTRFAINFFTSIGLGGLTDELRAHLKTMPKPVPQTQQAAEEDSSSSSSSDSDSSSSSSSSDSSDSDSSSSEEESPSPKKKKVPTATLR